MRNAILRNSQQMSDFLEKEQQQLQQQQFQQQQQLQIVSSSGGGGVTHTATVPSSFSSFSSTNQNSHHQQYQQQHHQSKNFINTPISNFVASNPTINIFFFPEFFYLNNSVPFQPSKKENLKSKSISQQQHQQQHQQHQQQQFNYYSEQLKRALLEIIQHSNA